MKMLGVGRHFAKVPIPNIQKSITSIQKQHTSGSSESLLGDKLGSARGFNGVLQRKWSSFKRLSELIGDITAQLGCR
jgi:hypothetical protein